MADNVSFQGATTATPAAGVVIATDEVTGGPTGAGTAHYQVAKLAYGALNTATVVAAGAGLPVALDAGGTVTVAAGSITLTGNPAVSVAFPATVNPGNLGTTTVSNFPGTVSAAQSGTWTLTIGGTLTDRSGTIAAGGTAQQLAAANSARHYLLVQNQSTARLYICFTGTATQTQTSLLLESGGAYESNGAFCPISTVSIIGTATGQAWHAVEY